MKRLRKVNAALVAAAMLAAMGLAMPASGGEGSAEKGDLYAESIGLVTLKHGMTRAELLKFQCVVGATWDREWDVLVGHLQQEDISGEACSILEEKIAELKALNPYDSWVAETCGGHAASITADHLEAVANSPTVKWHCASGELIDSISADRDEVIERISAE